MSIYQETTLTYGPIDFLKEGLRGFSSIINRLVAPSTATRRRYSPGGVFSGTVNFTRPTFESTMDFELLVGLAGNALSPRYTITAFSLDTGGSNSTSRSLPLATLPCLGAKILGARTNGDELDCKIDLFPIICSSSSFTCLIR